MPLSSMPVLADAVTGPAPAQQACDTCPHALAAHDAIGRRFCRATLAAALTRGCICRSS